MAHNAIIEELHEIRRELLAQYNGDTAAYLRDAQARLEISGHPIDHRKQRAIRRSGSTRSSVPNTNRVSVTEGPTGN